MKGETPRVRSVAVVGSSVIEVAWVDGGSDRVDLAGWISTGSAIIAPLKDPAIFKTARVSDYGSSVAWGDDEDLVIDAVHLAKIANYQRGA